METRDELEALARRYAPVLVACPEIPVDAAATAALRETHTRLDIRWASRPSDGAHMTRDFHPCDVRLILDHAQAWEPVTPLPFVPRWFSRAYRDMARFFFWPIAVLVALSGLLLMFAQGLPPTARNTVVTSVLIVLAVVYLVTLRSPILVPLDSWHHLNHAVIGLGVLTAWGTVFGTRTLWLVGPVIVIPTAFSILTSVAMRIAAGLTNVVLGVLQRARDLFMRLRGAARRRPEERRISRLFHGLKAAHEYTAQAELFYRDPHTSEPIHRSHQGAHWAAYSRIRASEPHQPVCYARVLDPDASGVRAIQYWYCYYYNDWATTHEGDWESAVVFVKDGRPIAVAASQHERGEYRDSRDVEWRGERPVLYVAAGSHALYFGVGAQFAERPIAGLQLTALDATLLGRDILDFVDFTVSGDDRSTTLDALGVVLIPDPDPATGRWGHLEHDPQCKGGCALDFEWLNFAGHWGAAAVALIPGSSGPRGPAFSGLKWDNPDMWARTMCRRGPA
jgi:hypothetical protein